MPDDLARARHTSLYWGSRELASAKALATEMPSTLSALDEGHISLYQSRLVTEATACLDAADRAEVDRRLSGSLAGTSTAEIAALVRGLVYEVDPNGFVERARKAAKDPGVSIRPARTSWHFSTPAARSAGDRLVPRAQGRRGDDARLR